MSLSGSPSSGGSGPFRRGLISCLHSLNCRDEDAPLLHDKDVRKAMYKLVVGLYDEAFVRLRLPCKTMPDLSGLLSSGGFCLGFLDPVSNIIINTLALLPKDAPPAASAKRSKKCRPRFGPWHQVATRSCHSLVAFLVTYFGCINEAQAIRYLYRADANLLLAVMLVQHDLYVEGEEAPLDPESDRTRAALEQAATTAGHPSPSILAQVMTIRLKHDDINLVKRQFSANGAGTPLTAEDAREIHRVLHMMMMTPMCVANISHTKDGLVVHVRQNLEDGAIWSETEPLVSSAADARITSTAFRWDGAAISSVQFGLSNKLLDCLGTADGQKHILKTPCGDACDYLQSLKIYLHGMIHNMYIEAFKLLPSPRGWLMRNILMAGHCYGSCDPVCNIIINSIWYDTCVSILRVSDRIMLKDYSDVLDPLSLLRLVVRSLDGLEKLALFAAPQSSIACAMEKLCSAKCVLVDVSSSAGENPFHEAAVAARHPLPLLLGEFHQLLMLMPNVRSRLLSYITEAQTSGGVLCVDEIRAFISMWFKTLTSGTRQAPELCAPELSVDALRVVSSKRLEYEERRSWFRSKIEDVLNDYTDRHFWGPKYKLDFIFGVEERNQGCPLFFDTSYHVNFMATSDPKLSRTLFYAEFWSSSKPKPKFCCPLPCAYAGRCYYDVLSARKIVYPDDDIPHDITHDGTGSVDGMLEMDLVYFSSELDVELAQNLNMLPSTEYDDGYETQY